MCLKRRRVGICMRLCKEVYGKLLDELWLSKSKELILDGNEKFSAETGEKYSIDFLRFRSEIYESLAVLWRFGSWQTSCNLSTARLAAWNALSNASVLQLLPPLANCFANYEGYLEPVQDKGRMSETYVKSWFSGALNRSAAAQRSATFMLVVYHPSHIFLGMTPPCECFYCPASKDDRRGKSGSL
ncbi:transcriptional elongation regulator MINIYO-like [Diospyros lotus]|uniref:transcriptional elongation regulator MINIYO-like n=1 Tax=Diospyros lotus TaxID=55363 RepID=UPI00224CF717|nr:transcriptional elongation regulator MINIYO-like [Diospyros lotus]